MCMCCVCCACLNGCLKRRKCSPEVANSSLVCFPLNQSNRVTSAYNKGSVFLFSPFPSFPSTTTASSLHPPSCPSFCFPKDYSLTRPPTYTPLTQTSYTMSESIGKWVKRDPNIIPETTTWSSEKRVYEWRSYYTKESAPSDPALEEELFNPASRINSGIHFKSYAKMSVSVKDGPPGLVPITSVSR